MRLTEDQEYLAQLRGISGLEFLRGKTVLITGASGMLGSCLVDTIMLWNREKKLACKVMALGRDRQKLEERFHDYIEDKDFGYIAHDVCRPLDKMSEKVDYIIHAASNADPANMAKYPVDTLLANVIGTKNLMEYGLAHGMERFMFISSGEVYGQPNEKQDDFTEDYCGPINLGSPRSCYPEGKRTAEVLCQSYASQYGADVVIMRPCHLFGPTMSRSDSRAGAEFIWSAVDRKDIILRSDGQRERSHCYVVDAVAAMLLVLERGEPGSAYNIADRGYQMTVREFAERTAETVGCKVVFDVPEEVETRGYSKVNRQVLCNKKLADLGWKPLGTQCNNISETITILRKCANG